MRRGFLRRGSLLTALFVTAGAFAADQDQPNKRIQESASVLGEIMDAKDHSIPRGLLERAQCVGIVPAVKRVGFIFGAKYGKGVVSCRLADGEWSAPSTIRVEGGNVGIQIGLGETDIIFVVMNPKGEERLLRDKFTIGVDATGMAGPVGREATAETDAMLRAEILAYSRAHGIFAGVTLNGSTLRPDELDNAKIYGKIVKQSDIVHGKLPPPESASELLSELRRLGRPRQ